VNAALVAKELVSISDSENNAQLTATNGLRRRALW
jgi:hypothetical protein